MLALVYDGQHPRLHKDFPDPRPSRDECLVEVKLAGVCSTDLQILKGYMGFVGVMGHEFVGVVRGGLTAMAGKRVVGEINCVCGRCDMCRSGLPTHCRDRGVVGIDKHDGVFARYVAMPPGNLHEVPANVSDEQAVFAEPLAAAIQVTHQVRFAAVDRVVVIGDGRLGQLVARVVAPLCNTVLVGRHENKLEAAEKAGIATRLEKDFRPSAEADVVIDATGSAGGLELAMRAVRPRGIIVLKSTFAGGTPVNLAPLVISEVTLIGSRCGPMGEALAMLAAGKVDVAPLISRTFALGDGLAALEAAKDSRNIKVLINVG